MAIGSQNFDISGCELPRPVIMAGENQLDIAHARKEDLLASPMLSLVSTNTNYGSCFSISSFVINIGGEAYTCTSNALSKEILTALKKTKEKYVLLSYLYIRTPEGLSVCFTDDDKK
jgi:hypothetical protein